VLGFILCFGYWWIEQINSGYEMDCFTKSQCQYSCTEIGTKSIHPLKIKGLVIV
jgi:uncharacterized protein involved in tolerance to divalent cations